MTAAVGFHALRAREGREAARYIAVEVLFGALSLGATVVYVGAMQGRRRIEDIKWALEVQAAPLPEASAIPRQNSAGVDNVFPLRKDATG